MKDEKKSQALKDYEKTAIEAADTRRSLIQTAERGYQDTLNKAKEKYRKDCLKK